MRGKILSLLIATTNSRIREFNSMYRCLRQQIYFLSIFGQLVEVLVERDNKEMSVGEKRQKLLERSTGEFVVFCDDDDEFYEHYVEEILYAIITNPDCDCIGLIIDMRTNGINPQKCFHSLSVDEWRNGTRGDSFDYYRSIGHFNPIRREKALLAGFPDIRFGEDKVYSDKVKLLCDKEYLIEKPLWCYGYNTGINHNEKYGIK